MVGEARERRPGLIVWAAPRGRADVVAELVRLGWDVNARGRGDVPLEQEWHTALHEPAGNGDLSMIELLLSLGAHAPCATPASAAAPLEWARHLDHPAAVRSLE